MPVVMNSASATLMSGSLPASFEATKPEQRHTETEHRGGDEYERGGSGPPGSSVSRVFDGVHGVPLSNSVLYLYTGLYLKLGTPRIAFDAQPGLVGKGAPAKKANQTAKAIIETIAVVTNSRSTGSLR